MGENLHTVFVYDSEWSTFSGYKVRIESRNKHIICGQPTGMLFTDRARKYMLTCETNGTHPSNVLRPSPCGKRPSPCGGKASLSETYSAWRAAPCLEKELGKVWQRGLGTVPLGFGAQLSEKRPSENIVRCVCQNRAWFGYVTSSHRR